MAIKCSTEGCRHSYWNHGIVIIPGEGILCQEGHISPAVSCTDCRDWNRRNQVCSNSNWSPGGNPLDPACAGLHFARRAA